MRGQGNLRPSYAPLPPSSTPTTPRPLALLSRQIRLHLLLTITGLYSTGLLSRICAGAVLPSWAGPIRTHGKGRLQSSPRIQATGKSFKGSSSLTTVPFASCATKIVATYPIQKIMIE
ncbi:hypothetical protein BU24DRAFT_427248, partial [Aaosphaeria arxii CBS 175.79]